MSKGKHVASRPNGRSTGLFRRAIPLALTLLMVMTGVALADHGYQNSNPTTREGACDDLGGGENVTAKYTAGSVTDARCEVISVGETVEEATTQVNNERAARAVTRTVKTTTQVTTTQLYKWDSGEKHYIADGDPLSEEGQALVEECMTTPGIDKCA